MKFTTLNTITTDILLAVRGSQIAESEPISMRQIEDWVNQYRSLFLKREIDKGNSPNPDYIQEIPFIELEEVPVEGTSLDSGYGGYTLSGNIVLKTKLKLPTTVNFNTKQGFTFIGTPEGEEIQYIPERRSKWQEYKKYTSNCPLVYLKDGYLYIINETLSDLSHLHVRGIFEIPSEVGRFVNPATDIPYFTADSKYPIPTNMLPALKELIFSKELRIEVSSPSDTDNDSRHGVSENVER